MPKDSGSSPEWRGVIRRVSDWCAVGVNCHRPVILSLTQNLSMLIEMNRLRLGGRSDVELFVTCGWFHDWGAVGVDGHRQRHSDASQNLSMLIKWYFLVPTRKYRKEALYLLLRSLIKVTVSLEQVNSLTLKQHLLWNCETEHWLLTPQRSIIKEYLSLLNEIIDSGSSPEWRELLLFAMSSK